MFSPLMPYRSVSNPPRCTRLLGTHRDARAHACRPERPREAHHTRRSPPLARSRRRLGLRAGHGHARRADVHEPTPVELLVHLPVEHALPVALPPPSELPRALLTALLELVLSGAGICTALCSLACVAAGMAWCGGGSSAGWGSLLEPSREREPASPRHVGQRAAAVHVR